MSTKASFAEPEPVEECDQLVRQYHAVLYTYAADGDADTLGGEKGHRLRGG